MSVILVALGAVLIWGVDASVGGVDVNAIGWILVIVAIIGGLLSLVFWASWGGFGGRRDDERVIVGRR